MGFPTVGQHHLFGIFTSLSICKFSGYCGARPFGWLWDILSGGRQSDVYLWDLRKMDTGPVREYKGIDQGFGNPITTCLALEPRGSAVYSSCLDGSVTGWNLETGTSYSKSRTIVLRNTCHCRTGGQQRKITYVETHANVCRYVSLCIPPNDQQRLRIKQYATMHMPIHLEGSSYATSYANCRLWPHFICMQQSSSRKLLNPVPS
jgi:hypothetical protein